MADAATATQAPSVASSKVNGDDVSKATNALLKWRDSKSKVQKPQLLENDEFLYLIVTLKKIPQKGRTNPIKIPLPHPLINPVEDSSELCLFIDDRSKSELTKEAAMKKIKSEDLPISKVIKLTKLRTDFRPFEAKRKLCDSYTAFFADKRVVPLLPRLLGKQFFKKKKIPVAIDLRHKNWKEQIEKICGSALFFLKTGTCSVVRVGKLSMGKEELVENVIAAINGIAEIVPSKWGNIRSLHLKLLESLALPVYQAVPDLKLKIDASVGDRTVKGGTKKLDIANADEDESVSNKKRKGRIHEVRYMDSNVSEMLDDEEMGADQEEEGIGSKKKKSPKKLKTNKLAKAEKDDDEMGEEEEEGSVAKKKKTPKKLKTNKRAKAKQDGDEMGEDEEEKEGSVAKRKKTPKKLKTNKLAKAKKDDDVLKKKQINISEMVDADEMGEDKEEGSVAKKKKTPKKLNTKILAKAKKDDDVLKEQINISEMLDDVEMGSDDKLDEGIEAKRKKTPKKVNTKKLAKATASKAKKEDEPTKDGMKLRKKLRKPKAT